MEHTKHDVPVFEDGDTIRLELRVGDDSGVARVETRFTNEGPESIKSVYRSVDLHGEKDTVAVIEFRVGEDLSPGNYSCEYIALTDNLGNRSVIAAPGIEFRVEGNLEDRQGPALLDWSFA
ncbi:MAG: hypothetical protein CYG60_02580 [Actinobacteria bacterium]|nr:MAG: hypothetical protein CYG60_02580 [Actinomycetota bacterium]